MEKSWQVKRTGSVHIFSSIVSCYQFILPETALGMGEAGPCPGPRASSFHPVMCKLVF